MSFEQVSETVSATHSFIRSLSPSEFQAAGPATVNRWECSSPSSTEELYDGGNYDERLVFKQAEMDYLLTY